MVVLSASAEGTTCFAGMSEIRSDKSLGYAINWESKHKISRNMCTNSLIEAKQEFKHKIKQNVRQKF